MIIYNPSMPLTSDIIESGMIMLIDKPISWTSFDVVNKIRHGIRHHFGLKKIKVGHAGTLDPLATGLLIICTGKMTKQIDSFIAEDKEYTGTMVVGATTPSYDMETSPDAFFPYQHIDAATIKNGMSAMTGVQSQKPPVYSAVKQQGKKLYEYARSGQNIEIKSREVNIHQFELIGFKDNEIQFKVLCSKGTYIRSLVYDLGKMMHSGAYLRSLRRIRSGEFHIDQAFQIETIIESIKQAEK